MFKKILLAYDGSDPAKKAFERCLEMSRCFAAELSIVLVIQPPEFAEDVETEAIIEGARSRCEREIADLQARASAAGLTPRRIFASVIRRSRSSPAPKNGMRT